MRKMSAAAGLLLRNFNLLMGLWVYRVYIYIYTHIYTYLYIFFRDIWGLGLSYHNMGT